MNHRTFIFLGLLFCTLAGCAQPSEDSADPGAPQAEETQTEGDAPASMEPVPEGQTEESATEAIPAVSLEVKSWEEVQGIVASHQGKIVVVDLWATYCGPCLTELPNLVKLHNEHGDKVKCITVSLDYQGFEDQPVNSYSESVQAVLGKLGASCLNILCSTDADTMYNKHIKQGSIPVVLVYDQSGKLVGEFPNPEDSAEFTYQADVIPLVAKMLN